MKIKEEGNPIFMVIGCFGDSVSSDVLLRVIKVL
jgi:hypothetical protein